MRAHELMDEWPSIAACQDEADQRVSDDPTRTLALMHRTEVKEHAVLIAEAMLEGRGYDPHEVAVQDEDGYNVLVHLARIAYLDGFHLGEVYGERTQRSINELP